MTSAQDKSPSVSSSLQTSVTRQRFFILQPRKVYSSAIDSIYPFASWLAVPTKRTFAFLLLLSLIAYVFICRVDTRSPPAMATILPIVPPAYLGCPKTLSSLSKRYLHFFKVNPQLTQPWVFICYPIRKRRSYKFGWIFSSSFCRSRAFSSR